MTLLPHAVQHGQALARFRGRDYGSHCTLATGHLMKERWPSGRTVSRELRGHDQEQSMAAGDHLDGLMDFSKMERIP